MYKETPNRTIRKEEKFVTNSNLLWCDDMYALYSSVILLTLERIVVL